MIHSYSSSVLKSVLGFFNEEVPITKALKFYFFNEEIYVEELLVKSADINSIVSPEIN